MSDEVIARRTALKYFGLLAATAAGQEFLASWLSPTLGAEIRGGIPRIAAHHPAESPATDYPTPYTPKFFSPDQFKTLELLTELIIPTDDQPGAREARVADYIDFIVFSAGEFKPEMQKEWSHGLSLLDELSQKKDGKPFRHLAPAAREQMLLKASLPEKDHTASHPAYGFYMLVKDMTVEGFYTSKIGLMDVLEYKGRDFVSEFVGCTHPEHQS